MIVYKIYNDINSKLYIGITTKTLQDRWKQHKNKANQGYNTHLYSAMRKYGIDKFHIIQIDFAQSMEELLEKEKYYVSFYNSYYNGYNMTLGGDSNPMDSLDVKNKHDNIMQTSIIREKISKTMREKSLNGELFSEEHRRHLSDASFKRYGNISKIKKKQFYHKKFKKVKEKSQSYLNNNVNGPTKGRKMLFDLNGDRRYVPKEEVDRLLELGWTLPTNKKHGDVPNLNTKQSHTYQSHMSAEDKHKVLSESHLGISPSNKGIPASKETKEKLSNYFKGTKWVNNGKIQKQVQPNELQQYLSNGFVLGQLKNKNKKEGDAK